MTNQKKKKMRKVKKAMKDKRKIVMLTLLLKNLLLKIQGISFLI